MATLILKWYFKVVFDDLVNWFQRLKWHLLISTNCNSCLFWLCFRIFQICADNFTFCFVSKNNRKLFWGYRCRYCWSERAEIFRKKMQTLFYPLNIFKQKFQICSKFVDLIIWWMWNPALVFKTWLS